MTELEKEIESKLCKKVKKVGGLCLKWVCPGWTGVPDRIVLLPQARVIFVELKRPKGGRVSKIQLWWHATLRRLGFPIEVVWNTNDLERFERLYLEEIG